MIDFSMLDASQILQLVGKGVLLLLIFMYAIFSLVIFVNVRRLNDVIQIAHSHISLIVQGIFLLHILLIISLFLFALAIL